MATQVTAPGDVLTFEANGDLSANIYNVVYQTTTEKRVALLTVASSRDAVPLGVLQDKPAAAGRSASVKVGGLCIIRAGAAVTIGRLLTVDTSGSAIHQSSAGEWCIGKALTAAGAAGDQISMLWQAPVLANSF